MLQLRSARRRKGGELHIGSTGVFAQGGKAVSEAVDRAIAEGQTSVANAGQALNQSLANPQVPDPLWLRLPILDEQACSRHNIVSCMCWIDHDTCQHSFLC